MQFTHLDSGIPASAGRCIMTPAHKYVTSQGRTYSSVTTVLGATKPDKSGLDAWRSRMGPRVADYIMQQAAHVGTAAHKLNELYLANDANTPADIPLLARAHHENFLPYLQRIDCIRGNELILWSDTLRLAGTSDCIAEYDGVLSIIDYKTKRSVQKQEWLTDYFLQAAAYAIMYKELSGTAVEQAVILVSSEADTTQEFVVDLSEYRRPFLDRLQQFLEVQVQKQQQKQKQQQQAQNASTVPTSPSPSQSLTTSSPPLTTTTPSTPTKPTRKYADRLRVYGQ